MCVRACVCVIESKGFVWISGWEVVVIIWPSFFPPRAAELRAQQPLRLLLWCSVLEWRETQEPNKKDKSCFALCMCLYVFCAVQIYCNEQSSCDFTSATGGSPDGFLYPPAGTFYWLQQLMFGWFFFICTKNKQVAWNITYAFKGFLKGCCAIRNSIWWLQDDVWSTKDKRLHS